MTLEDFLKEWNNDAPCVQVHTSGSTGEPKPLLVEKHRMEASARITCSFLGLKPGDTALLCMSLDYIAGKMMVVRALTCGLRLVCMTPTGHPFSSDIREELFGGECFRGGRSEECGMRNANEVLDGILPSPSTLLPPRKYSPPKQTLLPPRKDISLAAMVPMQVYNTLQVAEERERLMRVRHLIIGGGAIDDALASELRTFPNCVWSTYGMTETLSHIALRRLNGPEASDWYTPFDTVKVSLNAEGCLVIDAPAVCAEVLETNDRAEIAPDGRRFRILGRRDNVICSGGVKIQIEEVERRLRPSMPLPYMITRCRDSKFGEAVVLLMESEDTDQQSDAIEKAREVCRRVLPAYWRPKHYLSVPSLPMTPTGKPARKRAEDMVSRMDI